MTQKPGRTRADTRAAIKPRRLAHPGRDPVTGTRQNTDRNRLHDAAPILPVMQLRKVIRPHQPHKAHPPIAPRQRLQGLRGIARAQTRLDTRDRDARVLHHGARPFQPVVKRGRPARFQRIARSDQPPDSIQTKAFERLAGDMHMARVGRIE